MLPLRLHVLGTTAARPFPERFTSSVYVSRGGSSLLIDCGEGILTQVPPKAFGQRGLDVVCISHLHGDHVYGLPGLLSSMTLVGRTRPLTLLGPASLRAFLEAVFSFSEARTSFELRFPVLPKGPSTSPIIELRDLVVHSLPLRHRVEAFGFCVSSPPQLHRLRPGVVEQYEIPYGAIDALKHGGDYLSSSGMIANSSLTLPPRPRQTLAYLTDTAPLDAWPPDWPPPDVMLHDATFGPDDGELAQKTGHSTTSEATAFAKTANATTLLLTHGSVRYSALERFAMAVDAAQQFDPEAASAQLRVRWAVQGEVVDI